MRKQVKQIVHQATKWAVGHDCILAMALVGSQARGRAHAESDIDLMLLCERPLFFRTSTEWLSEIDWGDRRIANWADKDYGAVWSRHVYLDARHAGCVEVEFSFSQPDWACTTPLDPGTQRVVGDGCRILYDPDERLAQLVRVVSDKARNCRQSPHI